MKWWVFWSKHLRMRYYVNYLRVVYLFVPCHEEWWKSQPWHNNDNRRVK